MSRPSIEDDLIEFMLGDISPARLARITRRSIRQCFTYSKAIRRHQKEEMQRVKTRTAERIES